jgi:hypothetical protein
LSFLKIWECEAYVKKLQSDKLESKSEKYIFVGYPRETIGYTFYHPAEGKTFVAKTGIFLEKEFLANGVSGRKVELDEIVDPSLEIPSSITKVVPNAPSIEEEEGAPHENHGELAKQTERKSARLRKSRGWFGNHVLSVMLADHDKPATYTEAIQGPESEKWLEAIKIQNKVYV